MVLAYAKFYKHMKIILMQDYIVKSNETKMYKMCPLNAKKWTRKAQNTKKTKVPCNNKNCQLAKVMVITDIFLPIFFRLKQRKKLATPTNN